MTTTSGDPPREFAGHRLETLLRSASSGSLYQASSGDRSVALKVVSPSSRLDRSVLGRFLRSSPDRIRHPNLLPVEELGEHDGETYYTARLLRGDSLHDALEDLRRGEPSRPSLGPLAVAPSPNGKRPAGYLARIATLMAEVADGLSQAHAQRIVHGRLSPSKLVFSPAGRLVITDFDGTDDDNSDDLPYRSPELLRARSAASDPADAAPVEPSADVYALGAILYELATLHAPYAAADADGSGATSEGQETESGATTPARTVEAILAGDLVLPRAHAPDLPPALEHCILKALAPDPTRRYSSARRLAADLRAVAQGGIPDGFAGSTDNGESERVIERLERELERLRAKRADGDRPEPDTVDAEERLRFEHERHLLTEERDRLEIESERLEKERSRLEDERIRLENDRERVEEEYHRLEAWEGRLEDETVAVGDRKDALTSVEDELRARERELARERERRESVERKVSNQEEQIRDLSERLTQSDDDIHRRSKELIDVRAELAREREELASSKHRVSHRDEQVEAKQRAITASEESIRDREEALAEREATIEARERRLAEEIERLDRLRAALDERERTVDRREQSLDRSESAAGERVEALEERHESLEKRNRAIDDREAELRRQYSDLERELSGREQKLSGLESAVDERHRSVALERSRLASREAEIAGELEELRKQDEHLQSFVERIREEDNALRVEIERLEAERKRWIAEGVQLKSENDSLRIEEAARRRRHRIGWSAAALALIACALGLGILRTSLTKHEESLGSVEGAVEALERGEYSDAVDAARSASLRETHPPLALAIEASARRGDAQRRSLGFLARAVRALTSRDERGAIDAVTAAESRVGTEALAGLRGELLSWTSRDRLRDELSDPRPAVRASALEKLADAIETGERKEEDLVLASDHVASSDPSVRRAALAAFRSAPASEALLARLSDSNGTIAVDAETFLSLHGTLLEIDDDSAQDSLRELTLDVAEALDQGAADASFGDFVVTASTDRVGSEPSAAMTKAWIDQSAKWSPRTLLASVHRIASRPEALSHFFRSAPSLPESLRSASVVQIESLARREYARHWPEAVAALRFLEALPSLKRLAESEIPVALRVDTIDAMASIDFKASRKYLEVIARSHPRLPMRTRAFDALAGRLSPVDKAFRAVAIRACDDPSLRPRALQELMISQGEVRALIGIELIEHSHPDVRRAGRTMLEDAKSAGLLPNDSWSDMVWSLVSTSAPERELAVSALVQTGRRLADEKPWKPITERWSARALGSLRAVRDRLVVAGREIRSASTAIPSAAREAIEATRELRRELVRRAVNALTERR